MVILPLNVEASFPKWFPDFVQFVFNLFNLRTDQYIRILVTTIHQISMTGIFGIWALQALVRLSYR